MSEVIYKPAPLFNISAKMDEYVFCFLMFALAMGQKRKSQTLVSKINPSVGATV